MIFDELRKLNLKVGDEVKSFVDIITIDIVDTTRHYKYATSLGQVNEYGCYSGVYMTRITNGYVSAIKSMICLHLIRIIPV